MSNNTMSNNTTSFTGDTNIKYIAEGTFGCVFNSEIQCSSSNTQIITRDKKHYVSKVSDHIDKKEIEIGTFIKSIKQYDYFFSPILTSCPINIGLIANEEIQKCQIITKNPEYAHTKYTSSKILFIGENTLFDFFNIRQKNTNLISLIITTNLHLLKGINKLLSLPDPVIHFDIKEQNILVHDKYNIPVIIDFGISFTYNDIINAFNNNKDLHLYFYNFSQYIPWAIEISILSFIALAMKDNSIDFDATLVQNYINDFYDIIDTFPTNNPAFDDYDEIKTFTDAMKTFVQHFKFTNIKKFTKELMKNWASWDNYAIAVLYKRFLDLYNFPKDTYILNYYKILKNIVLFTPTIQDGKLRELPEQTIHNIKFISEK